jgi:hypothetical protein
VTDDHTNASGASNGGDPVMEKLDNILTILEVQADILTEIQEQLSDLNEGYGEGFAIES